LRRIVDALNSVKEAIVFPTHPRTQNALSQLGTRLSEHIRLIEPVSYYDMMMLEENARLIVTDSGGVQREAFYLEVPCLTLREETEWIETVEAGWNRLIGTETTKILDAWFDFSPPPEHPPIYGDGTAGQRIAQILDLKGNAPHSATGSEGAASSEAHFMPVGVAQP
jgi:UDP-GlcNAc3NAcA epimerase